MTRPDTAELKAEILHSFRALPGGAVRIDEYGPLLKVWIFLNRFDETARRAVFQAKQRLYLRYATQDFDFLAWTNLVMPTH